MRLCKRANSVPPSFSCNAPKENCPIHDPGLIVLPNGCGAVELTKQVHIINVSDLGMEPLCDSLCFIRLWPRALIIGLPMIPETLLRLS